MSGDPTPSRVFITVKTYPSFSNKYKELVCTAGVLENGSWVRIYPLPFRLLDYENRFKKYQWISLDLAKNTSGPRPESYRPVDWSRLETGPVVGTDGSGWEMRRSLVAKRVYTSMTELIEDSKSAGVSLATFRPSAIDGFKISHDSAEWDKDKVAMIEGQTDLFGNADNPFKVVKKVPCKFVYSFRDEDGKTSNMEVLDWEIGALYWSCLKTYDGDEVRTGEAISKKYFDRFVKKCDLHFFMGTTRQYHGWATNPFTIIGVFYPPLNTQTVLDL